MKPTLQAGVTHTKRLVVDDSRLISFMGEDARVYATPSLIRDIEHACRDLILLHAEPGEDSVGMEIAMKHLAPTLPGSNVEMYVQVTAVEGRNVMFEVSAKDDLEPITGGTHARFVVNVDKTVERLKAKAAKLKK